MSMDSDRIVTDRLTAYAPHRKESQASSWQAGLTPSLRHFRCCSLFWLCSCGNPIFVWAWAAVHLGQHELYPTMTRIAHGLPSSLSPSVRL
jgi:hypothetical protein